MFTPPGGRRGSTSVSWAFLLLVVLDFPEVEVPLAFFVFEVAAAVPDADADADAEAEAEAGEEVGLEPVVLAAVAFASEPKPRDLVSKKGHPLGG